MMDFMFKWESKENNMPCVCIVRARGYNSALVQFRKEQGFPEANGTLKSRKLGGLALGKDKLK